MPPEQASAYWLPRGQRGEWLQSLYAQLLALMLRTPGENNRQAEACHSALRNLPACPITHFQRTIYELG